MMTLIRNSEEGSSFPKDVLRLYAVPEDLQNDTIKRALEDIEGVYKVDGFSMYSREYGVKTLESISNGMATLIALSIFDRHGVVMLSSNMGANVAPYVAELSLTHDFTLCDNYFLAVPYGTPMCVKDALTGKVVRTSDEFHDLKGV